MAVSALVACLAHVAWATEDRARGMARRHVRRSWSCAKCAAGMIVNVWECELCGAFHYGHKWWK